MRKSHVYCVQMRLIEIGIGLHASDHFVLGKKPHHYTDYFAAYCNSASYVEFVCFTAVCASDRTTIFHFFDKFSNYYISMNTFDEMLKENHYNFQCFFYIVAKNRTGTIACAT